jgi:hypothetical protein
MERREFQLIEGGEADLPDYPFARDFRMPTHFFMPWHFSRWLNSRLFLLGSYEVHGVALALYSLAQQQAPVGTLPDDDALLARMLRMDVARWRDLRRSEVGPMHGWFRVRCDGETRWAHPVVMEILEDVARRRTDRELSKEGRARARRIDRLKLALAEMGVGEALLSDRAAIEAIEDYLEGTHRGNRTSVVYARALRWAADQGILNAQGGRGKPRA